jgi:hypothetical protein
MLGFSTTTWFLYERLELLGFASHCDHLNRSAALPDERALASETPPNSSLWREGELSTEVNVRKRL